MKAIIEKYLTGRGKDNEYHKLLDWLREDGYLEDFQKIKTAWESETFQAEMPDGSKESWNSLQNRLLKITQRKLQRSTRYLRLTRYAAVLMFGIFIVSAGLHVAGIRFKTNLQYSMVKAEPGQIAHIVLPDQTEVWLNSGSSVRYSNEFASSNREIELIGEAYFSVTKNQELPLVVTGSPVQIKVLGTKFNVSAYPDDRYFNVTLEEGKVELISDRYKDFHEELKPGHLAVFNRNSKTLDIKRVNVAHYTSWKDGVINIYNLPLEEVIVKLSKRYNQKFKIDEEVKQIRYTYTINNEPLSDVLKLMETITPIAVVQQGDIINLKYKK